MPQVILLPGVRTAMAEAIRYTERRFGTHKAAEYRGLIREALRELADNAEAGTRRYDIHTEAWELHLRRPGKRARHVLLYRVREAVEVAAFLHDAMNLAERWPEE